MSTRNVVLTEYHEAFIRELVDSGRYQNASEVLRDGLRLLDERRKEEEAMLAFLHRRAEQSESDLAAGLCEQFDDDFMDRILTEVRSDLAGELAQKKAV